MVVAIAHTSRAGSVILVRLRRLHRHSCGLHLRHYLRGLRLLGGPRHRDIRLGVGVNIWVLGGDWKLAWSSVWDVWSSNGSSVARADQGVSPSRRAALRTQLNIRFFMGVPPFLLL